MQSQEINDVTLKFSQKRFYVKGNTLGFRPQIQWLIISPELDLELKKSTFSSFAFMSFLDHLGR